SGGTLDVHAATVDNAGRMQGKDLLLSSGGVTNSGRMQGDSSLQLNASGRFTNNASGTLLSQNGLTLTAPELYNYGVIQGATSRVTTSGLASNSGKILSSADLTLNAPQLVNSGWLQASQLVLNAASASNSGTLMADQQATLTGNSLQNQGTAQGGNLAVNYAQLTNSGTLLGASQLNVKATNVTQQAAGKLFSGGNLLLESTGFDQLGQVVALGDATLKLINGFTARNILAAGNRLSIRSNGAIDNQGTLQGQALTLSAGGDLTNNGQITTGTGDSSLSGNRIIMNSAGTLQGGGNVALTSRSDVALNGFTGTSGSLTITSPGSIVNTALLYAGQNLYLYANSIKNQRGDMLAGNSLWMQRDAAGNANGEVINTSGTIESQNGDITIKTGHLLNTRDGLSTRSSTTAGPGLPAGAEQGWFNLKISDLSLENGEIGTYYVNYGSGGAESSGIESRYFVTVSDKGRVKRYLVSQTSVEATANGGAARIAAGRDLNIAASNLDNQASNLLSGRDANLSGTQLNNASWQNGTSNEYLTYELAPGIIRSNDLITGNDPNQEYFSPDNYYYYSPKLEYAEGRGNTTDSTIKYILSGTPEYQTTYTGDGLRAVIQAGGNVNASFSGDISNTSTTPNAGWAGTTVSAPALNHLAAVSQVAAQQRQQLATTDKVAINSPEWRDQLQNALQQVNGGTSLQNAQPETVGLSEHNSKQQGSANLGKAAELASGSAVKPSALGSYGASAVDTSAYPLPTSDNGYFVPGDSSSPYLITVNPKLNGLGQLDSSLFGDLNQLLGKQPGSAPQETRQQYTDVNTFLGSSYLLDRLNLKPDNDYRFLGDAAFDTRYVSNAVLNQTGSRYLNGVGSDLDQMRYLMDNAAASQQSLGLQFGVSLTADQVASLDKSIIWWEATSVNGQTVMVPKVYLSEKDAAMNNGSVIAGNNVTLSGGKITNSASTVVAQNTVSADSQNNIDNLSDGLIKAGGDLQLGALNNINNVGSTISGKKVALESVNGDINNTTVSSQWTIGGSGAVQAGKTLLGQTAAITSLDALSLKSGNDINITGASLNAGGDLLLNAWHDLSLNNIATSESRKVGNKETHSSGAERSTVSSGGNLTLVAGQDITSQAAALAAEGDIGLKAGRDINLNAAESGSGNSERGSKKTVINETVRQQGTEIVSGGSTTMLAGNDITSQAATVTANKDLALQAGHDVNITTATESDYAYKEETKTSKGLFSKKTTHTVSEDSSTTEKASSLSGDHVAIVAGHDLAVSGSSVVGESDVGLKAGNDLSITAVTDTQTSYRLSETKKSGMFSGGGIGVTFGSASSKQELKQDGTTESQSASTIGSTGGNVTLVAGHDARIAGSDVIAKQDISVVGGSVTIDPGNDTLTRRQSFEQKQSGLTLQLTSPITDALLSLGSQAKAASEAGDDRLKALGAVKALESGWAMSGAAGQSATALANGDMTNAGIKISLSVGASKSKSSSEYSSNTVSGSSLSGGGNVAVVATGANGTSGDVTLAGSGITGNNVTLAAAHDLNLVAASNNTEQKSSNKSSGWSAGVHVAIGQETGIGVQASGYMASGSENGSSTAYVNSRVNAKDNLTLSSGNDTLLSGAQALGNSISVNAGNNLTLTSLQDTDSYHS
uniref:hemagglutinin repeat-containing protein n=1 Tax=Type-E symbiont of Plautia stali TaxID=1560357 RepID=UPI000AA6CC83